MIQELVAQWNERNGELESWLREQHPESYEQLVEQLVRLVLSGETSRGYGDSHLDPSKIAVVDHGHYQGTQLFLVSLDTYQPDADDYVWFDNYYGSCSGCDTLEHLRGWEDGPPNDEQVKGYMDLALHMVQRMKWLTPDK